MGQARSLMAVLIDLNGFCEGRKNLVSTTLYAIKLLAKLHSTELRLRAIPNSAEKSVICDCAMPPSVKFK
jgi:hypothetical protein